MRPLFGVLAAWLAAAATAAPLPVQNAGFEEPYLGSNLPAGYNGDVPGGAFPVGPAPAGWTIHDPGGALGQVALPAYVGIIDPQGTSFFVAPGAPEGTNAALLYQEGALGGSEYGIQQALNVTLQPNTTYTLRVAVGNIASGTGTVAPFNGFGFYNLNGFPGYRVQLLAGGGVIAEDNDSLDHAEGAFIDTVVTLTIDASHPQLGQALAIRLINRNQADDPMARGLEVDFDDVRLDAEPVPANVPIPMGTLAVLGIALAVLGVQRARRRR